MKKSKQPSTGPVAPSPIPPPLSPTRDEIARRAEALWRQRGCPEARDEEIWLEAERQLSGGPGASPPTPDKELDSGRVISELDERFPDGSGKEPTSL
jgi:hypothetical protein